MPPERRARDTRPEVSLGPLPHGGEHAPHKRRLTLRRHPRLEVIGSHDTAEPRTFGVA